MSKGSSEPEVERLKKVYRGYEKSRRAAECWSPTNLGNRAMLHERRDVMGLEEKKAGVSDG